MRNENPAMTRTLCIALHDVAPATWPRCERLLALLDGIGARAITLLVVPDFHRRGAAEHDRAFIAAIEARRKRGDEIALHGYAHVDESAPPRSLSAWFRRRVLTDAEGEFSALDRTAAAQRITAGRDMLARVGWHVDGFVPPAWLASRGTREALAASDLLYTSTHTSLVDLRRGMALDAPSVTASPRSAWRRAMSKRWLRAAQWATRASGIVRAGLHPADAEHPDLLAVWRSLLVDWLREREPMTKRDAVLRATSAADAAASEFDVAGKAPAQVVVADHSEIVPAVARRLDVPHLRG
jgi:predicted deacetylase